MSASFVVMVPIALLAVAFLVCFVGCDPSDPIDLGPWTHYSQDTVLTTSSLLAYWRLSEPAGGFASDFKGSHHGIYTTPDPYPADAANDLAAVTSPTCAQGQGGIVAGDIKDLTTDERFACMQVNGGYVSCPSGAGTNPSATDGFTIEAWVSAQWGNAPAARRVVMMSRSAANEGYALYANSSNQWEVSVYDGAGLIGDPLHTTKLTYLTPIYDSATYHLVATYDGATNTLALYVDGGLKAQYGSPTFHMYKANLLAPVYIGAGSPELVVRPGGSGPLNPFVGKIQNVALYQGALSAGAILKHWHHGNGVGP